MDWIKQLRWPGWLALAGSTFLALVLLLGRATGQGLPFPWSLLLLVACASIGAGAAMHVFETAVGKARGAGPQATDNADEEVG